MLARKTRDISFQKILFNFFRLMREGDLENHFQKIEFFLWDFLKNFKIKTEKLKIESMILMWTPYRASLEI